MSSLTLISHLLCPYVQRAAIALAEKGVAFEKIYIDLAAKPDWFLKISPLGKVPLLKVPQADGSEAILFESSVIAEYVDESQAGPRLHPEDALTRARHRGWMEYGSSILSDIWGLETTKDAGVFEEKRNALTEKFGRLEEVLNDGPFFAGSKFSLVDAVFAPVFRYFDTFDEIADLGVFANYPKVRAWRKALAARPSVQDAVTPEYSQLLREFLKKYDAYMLTRMA
ncbi:glutathione S-transferase family protein [Phyllobacterium zundukense]|uniref:glutathione transferase n=1 Tax=Phyllobacterium zundukense TaxID=1867719 RepID=A0A2N9VRS5_9HYPH|nr:glutathione S-transferase family protein [Phyllobacterium zundukense]ATU92617.1 glutathione S-transferase [Phyllobacterium zundukense]PIO42193.1 glutathione S-transferase [Phyllobacterium zundukense]